MSYHIRAVVALLASNDGQRCDTAVMFLQYVFTYESSDTVTNGVIVLCDTSTARMVRHMRNGKARTRTEVP